MPVIFGESDRGPVLFDLRRVAGLVLTLTVSFNWILAFANTNLFRISEAYVIAAEIGLIVTALALIVDRRSDLYLILLVLISYFAFLMALKGYFDPKPIRDMLIPIIFFYVGLRWVTPRLIDRVLIVLVSASLVLALWEMLALNKYLQWVNIRGYYLARGTLTLDDLHDGKTVGLMINGERFMDRGLFSFLGSHRVTGLFLEPVSVGNFGVIVIAWITLRNWGAPLRALWLSLPMLFLMLCADARFGLYTGICVLAALPFARLLPVLSLATIPIFVIFALMAYGGLYHDVAWSNNFSGRVLLSGQVLSELSWRAILGFGDFPASIVDSGYGYMLAHHGAVGALVAWIAVMLLPSKSEDFARFRVFLAVYVSLLLIISTSLFSIKTGAVLWAMTGCVFAARSPIALPKNRPIWQRKRRPQQTAQRAQSRPFARGDLC